MTDHLLHLTIDKDWPIWRLECTHAPDDARWRPTREDGTVEPGPWTCWTIGWFEEQGVESLRGEWAEPLTFPAAVRCWFHEGLVIERVVEP